MPEPFYFSHFEFRTPNEIIILPIMATGSADIVSGFNVLSSKSDRIYEIHSMNLGRCTKLIKKILLLDF